MWSLLRRLARRIAANRHRHLDPEQRWELEFAAYKRDHPDAAFAQFYVDKALTSIRAGEAHSTLGLRLLPRSAGAKGDADFFEAGRAAFKRYTKTLGIAPGQRVIDYGCGSLRVGIHFMNYLDVGNYMGLDITRDFIDIGASAASDLIRLKQPFLAPIGPDAIAKGKAFAADYVVSNAVSYHVHPDEIGAYFSNLAALCSKPGAVLAFDAKLADSPVRFKLRGWAWPLEFYRNQLALLDFVAMDGAKPPGIADSAPHSAVLRFRRA
ncbi:MAG TPA: class I SAM-dependent methyltransferase [Rhizomicrobium sp.]|nr:class I SAM-dependent methyltransferase [Rhizomicrobium sp.]